MEKKWVKKGGGPEFITGTFTQVKKAQTPAQELAHLKAMAKRVPKSERAEFIKRGKQVLALRASTARIKAKQEKIFKSIIALLDKAGVKSYVLLAKVPVDKQDKDLEQTGWGTSSKAEPKDIMEIPTMLSLIHNRALRAISVA